MMKAKIDFSLSGRFNVVEHTIFRLVIAGVEDVETITSLLSVYSDEVIANAIKRLVNYQILRANIETRCLTISEPMQALIESCLEQSKKLELPSEIESLALNEFSITDENSKRQVLSILLPNINVGFLAKSIDFTVCEKVK